MTTYAIIDIETNGLDPSKVHCMSVEDLQTGVLKRYVGHRAIEQALRCIEPGYDVVVAHNGIGYDFWVLKKFFNFKPKKTLDSFVLSQMFFGDIDAAWDIPMYHELTGKYYYAKDNPLIHSEDEHPDLLEAEDEETVTHYEGVYSKNLVGKHGLEAWGWRLNLHKGDYSHACKLKGIDPWAEYNEDMGAYCDNDVRVTAKLMREWILPELQKCPEHAVEIEHFAADLMHKAEQSGIHFDVEAAKKLAGEIETRQETIALEIIEALGKRFEPKKYERHKCDENVYTYTHNQVKYGENLLFWPRTDNLLPPDQTRELWGAMVPPRVTGRTRVSPVSGKPLQVRANVFKEDHPEWDGRKVICELPGYARPIKAGDYTPIGLVDFNIGSRLQVARRLLEMGWQPEVFSDKTFAPKVDEMSLSILAKEHPVAGKIKTYFLTAKRLGQIKNGKNAWIKLCKDGKIHPRTNTCGTITFRGSHSRPNVSQTPAVQADPVTKKSLLGEAGEWGVECRSFFVVQKGWKQVGADLKQVELYAYANELYPYDGGALAEILKKDIHSYVAGLTGLDRSQAKRVVFAILYGAGDLKIGSIVVPTASETIKKMKGRQIREKLFNGIVGAKDLEKKLKQACDRTRCKNKFYKIKYGREGYVKALDGRTVCVRGPHAVLNTRLQSFGSGIFPKYWLYVIVGKLEELGLEYGYDKDWTMLLWSHDEVQIACREGLEETIKLICEAAAGEASEMLSLPIKIMAEGKVGNNWYECH